jgi:hypothetical protein
MIKLKEANETDGGPGGAGVQSGGDQGVRLSRGDISKFEKH